MADGTATASGHLADVSAAEPEVVALEFEVAEMIVETLELEDVTAADIAPEAPMFGEGLGLDSIDALELSLAITTRYGVQISAEDENNTTIFGSLRSLTRHIAAHRTAAPA